MADNIPVPSDASVSFTVKELIGRVDGKLDILISKIDDKATQEVVDRLATKVEAINALNDTRITSLEMERTAVRSSLSTLRFIILGAIPAIAGVAHFIH